MSFADMYTDAEKRGAIVCEIGRRKKLIKKDIDKQEHYLSGVLEFKCTQMTMLLEQKNPEVESAKIHGKFLELQAKEAEVRGMVSKIMMMIWKNIIGAASIAFEERMIERLTETSMEWIETYNDLNQLRTELPESTAKSVDYKDGTYKELCDLTMEEIKFVKKMHENHVRVAAAEQ